MNTACSCNKTQVGLTLIEIMITLSIVAVMASAVMLGVSASRDRTAEAEAQRLAVKLRTAADDALLSRRSYRLVWDEDGYRFEKQEDEDEFAETTARSTGSVPDLPGNLHLESDSSRNFIMIRPDGLGDRAILTLSGGSTVWHVTFDGLKADAIQDGQEGL